MDRILRRVSPDPGHPRPAISGMHPEAHPVVRMCRKMHELRPGNTIPYVTQVLPLFDFINTKLVGDFELA